MSVRPAPVRFTYMPSPETPVTAPDALTETTPVPLPNAAIPLSPPETLAAVTVIPPPPVPLTARMPSPATAATTPLTVIDTAPPPVSTARIPSAAPEIRPPPAACVTDIPAVPDCASDNAAPDGAAMDAFTLIVTARTVEPVAERCWDSAIEPMQLNAPAPGDVSKHPILFTCRRTNFD